MRLYLRPALLMVIAAVATAQSDAPLAFEVASIKPHEGVIRFSRDPGLYEGKISGTASTVADMITMAYGLRYDQLVVPDDLKAAWVNNDRFDLEAKAPGETPPTPDQVHRMMQSLLAERFELKVHRETRSVPIYALLVAKGGSKLKAAEPSSSAEDYFVIGKPNGLHMEVKRSTMQKLADQLSATAGRPVLDQTGLSSEYQYTLDWFPEDPGRWMPPNRVATDGDLPSMFTAVQELGLRLESTKGPQEFVIVDRVTKPSAN